MLEGTNIRVPKLSDGACAVLNQVSRGGRGGRGCALVTQIVNRGAKRDGVGVGGRGGVDVRGGV